MPAMTKIRESARGQECQIRVPGICNGDPATTVLCHLSGGGMGRRRNDLAAAYGCYECHNCVDGRDHQSSDPITILERKLYFYEAVIRTHEILLEKGLIKT